jgi:LysR family positive regulator for ilvC
MDFRSLQLFKHLATTLHFGDTASAMYVSPSTLSRVIQRLEEECGCELFARDNRSVALTHAGETLATFATNVLSQWDDVHNQFQQDSKEIQGELSLYCSVTASQSHLPNVIQQLNARYPKITLKLETGDPALAIKKVEDMQIDVALAVCTPTMSKDVHFTPIDDIPLVLIAPKQWRIYNVAGIDWQQHPVVLPELGYARDLVLKWFDDMQVKPNVYASVGGNEAIVSMVALGCGIGVVPQIVLDHSTLAAQVHRLSIANIEPYQLGLSCIASRRQQPLIDALFNVATELSY